MKSNVMPSIIQIDSENLKNLVKEVKETVATDINEQYAATGKKTFGIVDLWKCHKMARTAAYRRNY